jgi:integrase/recombinase XerD
MRESVARFLGSLEQERNFSANTISAYRNDLNQFVAYLNDELNVAGWAEVNEDTLRRYQTDLLERRYKDSTKARKTAAIKSFCGFMVTQGELRGDPAAGLVSQRVEKYVPKAMTEAQARALLQAPGGKSGPEGARDRAMLHALYATGMRVSELVSLNVADVDLEQGSVCCTGKQERRRTVPLGMAATEALRAYVSGPRDAIARDTADDALFLNHRGRRLTRQGFWLILKEYAEAADVRDITPHTLRHSFAAHAITHGSELSDVQRILGHVSIATTQIYQRIASDMREQDTLANGAAADCLPAGEPELAETAAEH